MQRSDAPATVPCSLTGGLLLGEFSEDGAVGLELCDSNLRAGFNRRGVSREQRQKQAHTVPNLHAQGLTDADQLPGRGVGVNDGKINALPRMAGKRAAPLVGNVFQTTLTEVGSRVNVSGLKNGFDDGDAHGLSQCPKFGRVFNAANQQQCTTALVVGPGLSKNHTTAARDDEGVLGTPSHVLAGWLVSYQPTSRLCHG